MHDGLSWKSKWGMSSLLLFVGFSVAQLGLLLAAIRFFLPRIWANQLDAGWLLFAVAFFFTSVSFCFLEWFVHRCLLHSVISSWFVNIYHRHGKHHGLTVIAARSGSILKSKIISKYFIREDKQWYSVSFADYTLLAFFGFYSPLLAILQSIFSSFPFLIAGYSAVTVAYVLYEVFHQLEHRPEEWWQARKNNPILFLLKPAIMFLNRAHTFHHLNPMYNMAIAGFFGIPLADICFGTLYLPSCSLSDGLTVNSEDIKPPEPARWVRKFDEWSRAREKRLLMELSEKRRSVRQD